MKTRTAKTHYGETVTLPKHVYVDGNSYLFRRYDGETRKSKAKIIGYLYEDFGSVLEIYNEMMCETVRFIFFSKPGD